MTLIRLYDLLDDIPPSVEVEVVHAVNGRCIPENEWFTVEWVVNLIRPVRKDKIRISVI